MPTPSGVQLFCESMRGATPALAPGTMILLGASGRLCAVDLTGVDERYLAASAHLNERNLSLVRLDRLVRRDRQLGRHALRYRKKRAARG